MQITPMFLVFETHVVHGVASLPLQLRFMRSQMVCYITPARRETFVAE